MDRRQALKTLSVLPLLPQFVSLSACKSGSGAEQCRYLGEDDDGLVCHKLRSKDKQKIDAAIVTTIEEIGIDKIRQLGLPLGNGCDGEFLSTALL